MESSNSKSRFILAVFLFCSIEFVGALPFLSDVLSFFWPGGPLSSFKLPLILLIYIIAAGILLYRVEPLFFRGNWRQEVLPALPLPARFCHYFFWSVFWFGIILRVFDFLF